VLLVFLAGALSAATTNLSPAQDASAAMHELAQSSDFRVRVTAALVLGRSRPPGAREALQRALSDVQPAVRIVAAAALSSLGDPTAIAALESRLSVESSGSVKAQIRATIEQLRRGSGGDAADASRRQLAPNVQYVVKLGMMNNGSGVRGDELRRVLHDAARSRARGIRGAAITDSDGSLLQQAAQRHLPVITLDGNVTQLLESRVADTLQVQAKVEFSLRRDQTLKGTLSGGATTFGSGPSISEQGRRQLQDDAIDGAVQSALRGADQGLTVAAR